MLSLLVKGGYLMVPLAICSVLALAIIIEKFITLRLVEKRSRRFIAKTRNIINGEHDGKVDKVLALCEITSSPLSRILQTGIKKKDYSREEIKESLEDAGSLEIPHLERHLKILRTIVTVAPLIGLLGTVTGMVGCFNIIQEKSTSLNPVSPGDLAGGISQALITTVAGLVVAIPTYVAYNYLVNRVDGFVLDMERSATDLINILTQRGKDNAI